MSSFSSLQKPNHLKHFFLSAVLHQNLHLRPPETLHLFATGSHAVTEDFTSIKRCDGNIAQASRNINVTKPDKHVTQWNLFFSSHSPAVCKHSTWRRRRAPAAVLTAIQVGSTLVSLAETKRRKYSDCSQYFNVKETQSSGVSH